jgi:hypothetical protein
MENKISKIKISPLKDFNHKQIISFIDYYIKNAWSLPTINNTKGIVVSDFINNLWGHLHTLYKNDSNQLLNELKVWAENQPIEKDKFYNNVSLEEANIMPNSLTEKNVTNFFSSIFIEMNYIIIQNFLKNYNKSKEIKSGDYFADTKNNCLILIKSITTTNNQNKIYNCILYHKNAQRSIGKVMCSESKYYNINECKICLEKIENSYYLCKYYNIDKNSKAVYTQYWNFSVTQFCSFNKEDISNTLIGYIHNDVPIITTKFDTNNTNNNNNTNIFVLTNAYAVTKTTITTIELEEYLTSENLNILKKYKKNNKYYKEWFMERIDKLFEEDNTILEDMKNNKYE